VLTLGSNSCVTAAVSFALHAFMRVNVEYVMLRTVYCNTSIRVINSCLRGLQMQPQLMILSVYLINLTLILYMFCYFVCIYVRTRSITGYN